MAADDDGADAVVAAVLVALDPDGVAGEAAGEVLQEVEGAGEHVVAGEGRQGRYGEAGGDAAERG